LQQNAFFSLGLWDKTPCSCKKSYKISWNGKHLGKSSRGFVSKSLPIQLALSRHEVESLRVYASLAAVWIMVRRTAFTELRHSWLRLAGTLIGLGLMFLLPLVGTIGGAGVLLAGLAGWLTFTVPWVPLLALASFFAWGIMTMVYQPAVRFFGLPYGWVWTLPLAGILYGLMTLDSAVRYVTGMRLGWRDHR
jgi:hypothetical protein